MKKPVFPLFFALCAALLCVGLAALDTVYVNDGGTGDGLSAASPLGSMTAALDAVKGGGTVIITETATLDEPIFDDAVTLCWRMPAGREETLRTALNELTRGGAEVEISAPQYAAF